MMRSFYQGIAGMSAMSEGLSITGNNIANSRTNGYKSEQAKFETLFYQQMSAAAAPGDTKAGTNGIEVGNGVKLSGTTKDLSQGTVYYTGNSSDLAISGDGYFVVGESNGNNIQYTRDGSFTLGVDNRLTTSNGLYVMGWNVDPSTGLINTSAGVQPIEIQLNQISSPVVSTQAQISGNLNATGVVGTVVGSQVPVYDTLGDKHDVNVNFIKTGTTPSTYTYVASLADDFISSASISSASLHPSEGIANQLQKGSYQIVAEASQTPGMVTLSVVAPDGTQVLSKEISDSDQTVTLSDGTNDWFTVQYKAGNAPSTAEFQIGEVGTMEFGSSGQLVNVTGSGNNGEPQIEFTSLTTGEAMNVSLDLTNITALATDSTLLSDSNGFPAAILKGYSIGNNGVVYGAYSDGSTKAIAQVGVATFANPSGLTSNGQNLFSETANSGNAQIGASGLGSRGSIIAGALENSNVDIATELTELMFYQKAYTANSKTISISNDTLDVAINLIR